MKTNELNPNRFLMTTLAKISYKLSIKLLTINSQIKVNKFLGKRSFFNFIGIFLVTSINAQLHNFQWAKHIYTQSGVDPKHIVTDSFGNVYTCGVFNNTADFDPSAATFTMASNGGFDIFIQKLDANGNFIWAKQIGGIHHEHISGFVKDVLGNLYLSGDFQGTVDFDPTLSTYTLASASLNAPDIYVLKLDNLGNLIWVKRMGDTGNDVSNGIALDALNNIYNIGFFSNTVDFDPSTSNFNLAATSLDGYIQKLDAMGNFVWAKQIEGLAVENITGITLDANGNIYTTGLFSGAADFDPGITSYSLTANAAYDIFTLKLNSSGNFVWAKQFVGNGCIPSARSIKLDSGGNIYSSGYFCGTFDFDPSASIYTLTAKGNSDAYVVKQDPNGNFSKAIQFGGNNGDGSYASFIDGSDNIYLTGLVRDTVDFDPGPVNYSVACAGSFDSFILKLNSNLDFNWVTTFGSTQYDAGEAITLDINGNIYNAGAFSQTVDFDPSTTTFTLSAPDNNNGYILKLSQPTSVSIDDKFYQNDYKLFPNPSTKNLNLIFAKEKKNVVIEIYDSLAQLIDTKEENNTSEIKLELNVPYGIYFIKITTENINITKKIIKN